MIQYSVRGSRRTAGFFTRAIASKTKGAYAYTRKAEGKKITSLKAS